MEIKRRVVSKGQGGVGRPQGDRGGGGSLGERSREGERFVKFCSTYFTLPTVYRYSFEYSVTIRSFPQHAMNRGV